MSGMEAKHLASLMAVGPSRTPGSPATERSSFTEMVLESVAQKYGARWKYADMLLPEKGGSLAVARDHVRFVLAAEAPPVTLARCQKRLFVLGDISNRCAPAPEPSWKIPPSVFRWREGR